MKGSCLCNAIAYEVDRLDGPIEHCSCRTCRKAHAAAFNSAAPVRHDHFRWLRGADLLKGIASSPQKTRYFCTGCGTHLVAQLSGRDFFLVRVATLDEDPGVTPGWRMWASHDVPWLAHGPDIPVYPEWEPGHA